MSDSPKDEFEQAATKPEPGLAHEMWAMLVKSKKWWLLPVLLALAVIAVLVILGATGLAPFIYTLF